MKLITMSRQSEAVYSGVESLDRLWAKAQSLGTVKVDRDFSTGQYVEISFRRKTGSLVYARGSHSEIIEAVRLAIEEAESLGAQL